jgi:hypothetical protein
MIVGVDARVAFRVVTDVEQNLAGVGRNGDPLEDGARAASLFVDGDRAPGRTVRIADCVGTALRDCSEQRLSGARPVDIAARAEAVSGDSTNKSQLLRS